MNASIFGSFLMFTMISASTADAQEYLDSITRTPCEERVDYTPENRLHPWTARCAPIGDEDGDCDEDIAMNTETMVTGCRPLLQGDLVPGEELEIVLLCDVRDFCGTLFSEYVPQIIVIHTDGSVVQNIGIPYAFGNVTALHMSAHDLPLLWIEEAPYDCGTDYSTIFLAWDERSMSYVTVYRTSVIGSRMPFSIAFDVGDITDCFGTWKWDESMYRYRNYRPRRRLAAATCRQVSAC